MKTFAQILLVVFFSLFFLTGLIAGTFKFQILNYNFWQNTFQKHNVYQNLAIASKSSFESQISKEGGNKNDVSVLSDLITPDNAKDVVNKNMQNFLNFANGRTPQINVYLPIDKVPKNLLPKSITGLKTDMTLQELLTKFSFQDYQNLPLTNISRLGSDSLYSFAITVLALLTVLTLLILLVEKGSRFISLGIAFILSGGLVLLLSNIGSTLGKTISSGIADKTQIASVVSAVIFPSVITELMVIWKIVGLIAIVLGFGLFFVKKWGYNDAKKRS